MPLELTLEGQVLTISDDQQLRLLEAAIARSRAAMLEAAATLNHTDATRQSAARRAAPAEPWRYFLGDEDRELIELLADMGLRPKVELPAFTPAPVRSSSAQPTGCGGDDWNTGGEKA